MTVRILCSFVAETKDRNRKVQKLGKCICLSKPKARHQSSVKRVSSLRESLVK